MTPGATTVNVIALIGDMFRRLDTNRERCEIFVGQQPTFLVIEIGDFPGDFTLVDQVACGLDTRVSVSASLAFDLDHSSEGVRQVFLDKDFPNLWNASTGVVHFGG